jgi:hypothetical protein
MTKQDNERLLAANHSFVRISFIFYLTKNIADILKVPQQHRPELMTLIIT